MSGVAGVVVGKPGKGPVFSRRVPWRRGEQQAVRKQFVKDVVFVVL